jgi:hypothetical protein
LGLLIETFSYNGPPLTRFINSFNCICVLFVPTLKGQNSHRAGNSAFFKYFVIIAINGGQWGSIKKYYIGYIRQNVRRKDFFLLK